MRLNRELLRELEESINTRYPEKSKIPIKILGWGEISLVFEIINDSDNVAYKRIPIFDTEKQVKRHIWAYNKYNTFLSEKVGIKVPEFDTAWFKNEKGEIMFYCVQEKVPPKSIGNKVIHALPSLKDLNYLMLKVLREIVKVWRFNINNTEGLQLGLDGQISNFSVLNYNLMKPRIDKNTKLVYLDTSTPMFRINGLNGMEPKLFLTSTPWFLRGIIQAFFLDEVVDRYYDLRDVVTDLLANFFKEQMAEVIPFLVNQVNTFFTQEALEFGLKPFTVEEIKKYYDNDKMIWQIFQGARKIDRYIKTQLLHKKYRFFLPENIER
jgi:hypothetical protein